MAGVVVEEIVLMFEGPLENYGGEVCLVCFAKNFTCFASRQ